MMKYLLFLLFLLLKAGAATCLLYTSELKGCSFTGTFTHQRLERILEWSSQLEHKLLLEKN